MKLQWTTNGIGLYTIVRREIVRFMRIWSQTLLPSVITTTLYFIIFGHLMGEKIGQVSGVSYMNYIAPGLILMAIITNAYGNVVASFFMAKFQKSIEELLVSPLSNLIIISGYVLGGVARGVTIGILVTVVALFFTKLHIEHMGFMLSVAVLTAILFSLAGLVNGVYAKKFDDINIVPTFVLTPLTYLGGVFYSIQLLPTLWQGITQINPIFYMINAFRFGMLGYSDVDPLLAIWVITGCIIVLFFYCLWLFREGIGIKS